MSEERQPVKYLYGASVQGIQSFIMDTNDLKSIIGASELVEQVCTTMFDEFANDCKSIVRAAGNIKVMFDNEDDCRRAVHEFPKKVTLAAPGITISQAVIRLENFDKDNDFGDAIDRLENALRVERNKPSNPVFAGVTGMLRSRRTGRPATREKNGEYLDLATVRKLNALAGKNGKQDYSKLISKFSQGVKHDTGQGAEQVIATDAFPTELSRLTGDNDWIAIIHADGNGFGLIVQEIGKHYDLFPEFSKAIDECTSAAAKEALTSMRFGDTVPIRPVVLSGDDLTVICRADCAMEFTRAFLEKFHEQTEARMTELARKYSSSLDDRKMRILKSGLTACAGIAYMKSSYPFYYGYNLAETLCGIAKKDSKSRIKNDIVPASLAFYRINDSYIHDFSRMKARELEIDVSERERISLFYGPYYLESENGRWTIDNLREKVASLETKNNVKSDLRHWSSLLYSDTGNAAQFLKRTKEINKDDTEAMNLLNELTKERIEGQVKAYPAYDVLSCFTFKNQKTKE